MVALIFLYNFIGKKNLKPQSKKGKLGLLLTQDWNSHVDTRENYRKSFVQLSLDMLVPRNSETQK